MLWKSIGLLSAFLLATVAFADDGLLGNGGGASGGSGSGGNDDPPIRTEPPPKRANPPIRDRDRDRRDWDDHIWSRPGYPRGPRINQPREAAPLFPNRPGRTGISRYGTVSNRYSEWAIELPPMPAYGSEIQRQVLSESNIRRAYEPAQYRDGYYFYDPRWRDDSFTYPFYRFGYTPDSVPSPFYGYPHLPGYLTWNRVTLRNGSSGWDSGDRLRWEEPDRFGFDRFGNNDRYSELDYAVTDVRDAFRMGRINEMASLLPGRGQVTVEVEDSWTYSLHPDDFYDMMKDLVETTETVDYRIQDVKKGRDGHVHIFARHTYRDPWMLEQTQHHGYELKETRRGYEIVRFRAAEHSFRRW